MIEISKLKENETFFKLLVFSLFLIIVNVLVVKTKIGFIILIGLILFFIALVRPKIIYFFMIALFSIEGFSVFQGASYAKLLSVILVAGLTLKLLMMKGTIPRDDSYVYFLLFLVGSIFSFLYAKNISVSVQVYITYLSLGVFYILTRYFLKTEKDIYIALDFLFVFTIVSFVYLQINGIVVYAVTSDVPRVSGGIGDSNEYASYILVLLPLAIYRAMVSVGYRKLLYSAFGFLSFVMLIYTGSRGGVLGFLGASVIFIRHYSFGRLKSLCLLLITLAAILYFLIPEGYWARVTTITASEGVDSSKDVRTDNYRTALKMFIDNPISGVGLSNFQFRSTDYGIKRGGYVVHNTYLEILTGGGLLSFIPFALILIHIWKKLKIRNKYQKNIYHLMVCLKASFLSILITSFFITVGHKKILWFLLALISSVYYISLKQNKQTMSEGSKAR